MKRKVMLFVIFTVLLCMSVTTVLFILITNNEYITSMEKELKYNNKLISGILQSTNLSPENININDKVKDKEYRLTIIKRNGKVIYDSVADAKTMENHNNRKEVIAARKKSYGISIRYSRTLRKNMLYVASSFHNGYVIRSSISLEMLKLLRTKYIKYYILTVLLVIIVTIIISLKLSYIITRPIKELENVTKKFSKGELDRRVRLRTKDEIGEFADTFNYMADTIQNALNDSQEKQNKLEAILRSMDSGVIAIDRNQKVIMINPYAEKIFGISKDSIGKQLMDVIRDIDVYNVLAIGKEDIYSEIKILWPQERVLRIRTADIVNASEHIGIVAVIQDITDMKKLENMRTEFVANVSHELKTPLTSIKGFAETLRYVNDDINKNKFLNIINDEADRLTRLINDILTLSDLEHHKEESEEIISVGDEIRNVYNLMKNAAKEKAIELKLEVSDECTIEGSEDRFKQMLINLVDNAIKYSEKGDVVTIGSEKKKEGCCIWVKDTGVGIAEDKIPRLFERFYRVDKARSRTKGGTGLGLAIVKHIVIGFKGAINVESEIGKGSKFIVVIPVIENKK
ncbi:two-component system histidine kinase PnpS [Clostridium oryzae]|uniref:histidine kinase n=1 Tax=Clostridium oryzae TaxID=1450648 RepID=A0A1V4IGQ2_9CLOT|nr:ATP-binding protein [Clostridium oryzae]OPJ59099.1 alkaline phosphatase synthesis sensor protein PhoR [Clostridium oryzae]